MCGDHVRTGGDAVVVRFGGLCGGACGFTPFMHTRQPCTSRINEAATRQFSTVE